MSGALLSQEVQVARLMRTTGMPTTHGEILGRFDVFIEDLSDNLLQTLRAEINEEIRRRRAKARPKNSVGVPRE